MAKSLASPSKSSSPALLPMGSHQGRPAIPLSRPANVIGSRQDTSRIHLDSSTVSKAHAVIVLEDTGCYISDLGSRMGVYINHEKVTEAVLKDGDEIQIGRFTFQYAAGNLSGAPKRAPRAALDVSTLGNEIAVEKRVLVVGQRRGSDIEINSKEVSNIHAIIFERNGTRYVRDMGSRTGTWFDETKIHQEEFKDEATIKIGSAKITCICEASAAVAVEDEDDAISIAPEVIVPVVAPVSKVVAPPEPKINLADDDHGDELDLLIEPENDVLPLELEKPAVRPTVPIIATPEKDTISLDDDQALELIDDIPLTPVAPVEPLVIEPIVKAPEPKAPEVAADDEDALQLLRRGWHGSSQVVEPELPVEDIAAPSARIAPEVQAEPVVPTPVAPPIAEAPVIVTEPPIDIADIQLVTPEETDAQDALDLDVDESSATDVSEPMGIDLADEDLELVEEVAATPVAEELPPTPVVAEEPVALEPEVIEPVVAEVAAPVEPVAPAEPEPEHIEVETELVEEPIIAPEPEEEHVLGTVSITQLQPAVEEHLEITPLDEVAEESLTAEPPVVLPSEPITAEADDVLVEEDELGIPDAPPLVPPDEIDLSSANFAEPANDELEEAVFGEEAEDIHFKGLDIEAEDSVMVDHDAVHDDEHIDDAPAEPLINLGDDDHTPAVPTLPPDVLMDAVAPAVDTLEPKIEPQTLDTILEEPVVETADAFDAEIEAEVQKSLTESAKPVADIDSEVAKDDLLDFLPNTLDHEPTLEDLFPQTPAVMGGSLGFVNTGSEVVMGGGSFVDTGDVTPHIEPGVDTGSRTPLGGESTIAPTAPIEPTIPDYVPTGNAAMLSGFAGGHERVLETPIAPAAEAERPHRVGFNGAETTPTVSPFAGSQTNSATIADLLIGMRAKSSVDVFSSPSPVEEVAMDYLGGGLSTPITREVLDTIVSSPPPETEAQKKQREAEMAEISITAMKYRPRGEVRPVSQTEVDQFRPGGQLASAIAATLENAAIERRRHMRVAIILAILILPLSAIAFMVGYRMTVWNATLTASLTFEGLDTKLDSEALRLFRAQQNDILLREDTRRTAIEKLNAKVDPAFLRSAQATRAALVSDPSVRWPDKPGTTMNLVMLTSQRESDEQRLRALAEAILEGNADTVTRRNELEQTIRKSQGQVEANKERIQSYQDDITKLRVAGAKPMPADIILGYDRAVNEAQKALVEAKGAQTNLEAAVLVLSTQAPTTRPVGVDTATEIARLDKEIADLTTTLDSAKKDADALRVQAQSKSEDARKTLDTAIVEFQKQLELSQKVATDNPELKAYIESAATLFKQTKDLTDGLLRRQETNHTRLRELQQKLTAMNEARVKEIRDTDPKLKEYSDQVAILTRQYNAADKEGMTAEANSVKMQLKLMQELAAERESALVNEPAWVESMASLQKVIDQTSNDITSDRQHVNETLSEIEKKFSASTPQVANLPDDQRHLTEEINGKIAAIAKARQDFNALNEISVAEQQKRDQEAQAKLAGIEQQIAARKMDRENLVSSEQALAADAERVKKLAERRKQLDDARVTTEKMQIAYDNAVSTQQAAKLSQAAFSDSAQKLSVLEENRDELIKANTRLSYTMGELQKQVDALIVPGPQVNMQVNEPRDNRPIVGGAAAGGMFLILLIPIVVNMVRVGREKSPVQANEVRGFDPTQIPTDHLQAEADEDTLNGSLTESVNGHVNGKAEKSDHDSGSRL